MKNSQKKPISEYDNILELSIHTFEKQIRDDVAQIFHTHTVFVNYLDKLQNNERKLFYDLKKKIDKYMKTFGKRKQRIVFLFDIDETLAAYGSNKIRPAGEVILQYIQQCYTNAVCGICSARDNNAVTTFASMNGLGSQYVFSSREVSSEIDENEAEIYGLQTNGARNKYNTWKQISQQYSDVQFVLIDDLFDNQKLLSDQGVVLLFDRNMMATQFDIHDYI